MVTCTERSRSISQWSLVKSHWALGIGHWGQGERLISSSHPLSPCPLVSPVSPAPTPYSPLPTRYYCGKKINAIATQKFGTVVNKPN